MAGSQAYLTKKRSGMKFTETSVDENLFGTRKVSRDPDPIPEFDPPWMDSKKSPVKKQSRPLLFYCPTNTSMDLAVTGHRPVTADSSLSPQRRYKPVKFSPTFVDDTLFGQRKMKRSESPPPKDFDPPWKLEAKRPAPLMFDYYPTRVMREEVNTARSTARSRPHSRARSARSTPRDPTMGRPAWR